MSSDRPRFATVDLPEGWQARTEEGFGDLFDLDASDLGVEPEFLATLQADIAPTLNAAVHYGLIMLAAFVESIDPEPVELDVTDLEVPFDADDIAPVAIAATLALIHQGRPPGGPDELLAAMGDATGRWLTDHEQAELPIGPTIITREVMAIHPPTLKRASDVMVVSYYVFPEDDPESMLVAIFRTPSLGFAAEFDLLFASMASTIQLIELDESDAAALAAGPPSTTP
jgi:hypothetical protein